MLSEFFERRMGLKCEVTNDQSVFSRSDAPVKINYTDAAIENAIHIKPQGLLSEKGIRQQQIPVGKNDEWQFTFWQNSPGEVPFDVLSASFYLLSRYEEYNSTQRDGYNRFEASSSLAFKYGFLEIPLIDKWVEVFKVIIKKHVPSVVFNNDPFTQLSTIDIDFAYRYKGIGLIRWSGKLLKSAFSLRISDAIEQLLVTFGGAKDPFDTYGLLEEVDTDVSYFILIANKGDEDKACSSTVLKPLIRELQKSSKFIGIHPSLHSSGSADVLTEEIEALRLITGCKVKYARNHFLKLELPLSYKRMIAAGIMEDYTMMYADAVGFRASTCKPFLFYDIGSEQTTSLKIYSTCLMDVTLRNYLELTPDEAINRAMKLRDEVEKSGGHYITLWHNSNISKSDGWKNWQSVYYSLFTQGSQN